MKALPDTLMKWWKSDKGKKVREIVKKTGYVKVAILIFCGLLLVYLSLPGKNQQDSEQKKGNTESESDQSVKNTNSNLDSEEQYTKKMEKELTEVLKQVKGVGNVSVMITLKSSSETIVNKDRSNQNRTDSNKTGETNGYEENQSEEQTVIMNESDGGQKPFVVKQLQPEIAGIVVICDGGDNSRVISDITSAAEVLFSVSAHKVKVMKKV